jgi:hypothetical protein
VGRKHVEVMSPTLRRRLAIVQIPEAEVRAIYRGMPVGHLLQLKRAFEADRHTALCAETTAFCHGRLQLIAEVIEARAGRLERVI